MLLDDVKRLSYAKWIIATHQNLIQRQLLELTLQKAKVDYYGTYPPHERDPVQKEFIRELEIELAKGEAVRNELVKMRTEGRVKRFGVKDLVVLKLYEWATGMSLESRLTQH